MTLFFETASKCTFEKCGPGYECVLEMVGYMHVLGCGEN
jgi:hypothetical protein